MADVQKTQGGKDGETAQSFWYRTMREKTDGKPETEKTWVQVDGEWVPTAHGFWEQMLAAGSRIDRVDTKSSVAILASAVAVIISIINLLSA